MSLFKIICSIILLLTSLTVSAESIDQWLDKMSQAMKQQNFKGTLIIRQGDSLQAIEVRQGMSNGQSWQTLESKTGEDQIIFRKNGQVTTIFPSKKLVTITEANKTGSAQQTLHPVLPKNRDKLKKLYTLILGAEARVANKITQKISVIPRDKHRYGYTFWLDKQSGLLLKCDLISNKGRVIEQQMYSDIELLASEPVNQINEFEIAKYRKMRLSNTNDENSKKWRAQQIPMGFVLKRSVKIALQKPTYHMVFSDGMASVSVFIETAREKKTSPVGRSHMGPVNAYSSFFDNTYVTAIGEVPPSTVQMIAQSIRPVQ
ncbi:hypothetical protein MNBD_GAMMA07-1869 [hydrothermal vent metagenome]|uniref:Sigma factor RpoE negative regulatory protein RseB n=1 Tax=hydrothermal vent metagenome TaxID=652676 RepID=A0A3B0WA08_9ZZZZ